MSFSAGPPERRRSKSLSLPAGTLQAAIDRIQTAKARTKSREDFTVQSTPKTADAGKVMTQLIIIFFIVALFILSGPSTNATPVMAPIKQWVVETLNPNWVAINTVNAVEI